MLAGVQVGCSGGGDGGSVTVASTNLRVQVIDSNGVALSNIDVVLHAADERAVEQIETTDSAGIADFGNVGRSRVTVTAGQMSQEFLRLETHVAVPGGERVFVFPAPFTSDSSRGTISATFSVPASGDTAGLAPVFAVDDDLGDGEANFNDAFVSDEVLGSNDALTLLAVSVDADDQLTRYGFLLDQTFADGAHYNGSMDRMPADVPWSSNAAQSTFFLVGAARDDVPFILAGATGDPAQPEPFQALSEFPSDRFFGFASTSLESDVPLSFRSWARTFSSFPARLDINFADFTAADLAYDAAGEAYSWSVQGSGGFDGQVLIRAAIDPDSDDASRWEIRLPPDRRNFTLPELPSSYEARVSRRGEQDGAAIRPTDLITSTGYDAFDAAIAVEATGFVPPEFDSHLVSDNFNENDPPPEQEPEPPAGPGLPGLPELPVPGLPGG